LCPHTENDPSALVATKLVIFEYNLINPVSVSEGAFV
jgi:hypothetical protein